MIAASDFNVFDFEYLTGHWHGPMGAAFNVVAEDCREAGWGNYGEPTEKGQELIELFRMIPVEGRNLGSVNEAYSMAEADFMEQVNKS